MELYQRKGADGSLASPYWYYDVTLPDGTRRRRSTKEKVRTKAQKVMVMALAEAEEEAQAGPRQLSLRDAMVAYIEDLKVRRKRLSAVDTFVDKSFATGPWASRGTFGLPTTLKIGELTESHLEALRAARRREGRATGSIAQELKIIRAAVVLAGRMGFAKSTIKWNVPTAPGKTRWLSVDEWQRVYRELDPDKPRRFHGGSMGPLTGQPRQERESARDLFVALTMCGGRWGEVSRLTTDQVLQGPDGVVRVRLYGWKTGKERMVPVPPMMAEMLVRRATDAVAAGTPYLFPLSPKLAAMHAADPERRWLSRSKAIRRALDRAGLNAPHIVERQGVATLHSLRHTFASWLRQAGMSLAEIQELLGHEAESMTKRYAHVAPHATVDLASKVISGVVTKALEGVGT